MLLNRFRPSSLSTAETVGTIPNHTHQQLCTHTDTFCPRAPRRPRELLNIRGTNVAALVASPCLWESVWWWKGSKFGINIIPSRLPDTTIPPLRRRVRSFDLVLKWTAFLGCAAEQVPWCSVYRSAELPLVLAVFHICFHPFYCLCIFPLLPTGFSDHRLQKSLSESDKVLVGTPGCHPFNRWS